MWFVYTLPEGGESPSEPSQSSDFEDVYTNSFLLLQGKKRDSGACSDDHNAAKRKAKKASANNGVMDKPDIYYISYWDSKDAANFFGFNYDKADNVVDSLNDRIILLAEAFTEWKRGLNKVVTHSEEHMTKFSIFTL